MQVFVRCGYSTPPLPAMDSTKFAWKEERYKIYTIMPWRKWLASKTNWFEHPPLC